MGRLTEDMTRLVGEINSERGERARLMRELRQSTSEMRRAVGHLIGRFHAAHAQMARDQRRSLRGFASQLHHTVSSLRTAFASDLDGARTAFFGSGAMPPSGGHSKRAAKSHSGEAA